MSASAAGLEAFVQSASAPAWRWRGRVVDANAQTIESYGPPCFVGECCEVVDGRGRRHAAEVIGFRGERVVAMLVEETEGVRRGDSMYGLGRAAQIALGDELTGRVMNGAGLPMDGGARVVNAAWSDLHAAPPAAMLREPIVQPLATGVRAIDGMMTVGRGQRVGIFGGSGVGKSTLIGMMTRNTEADLTVVGLVGERGREVREFLDDALGPEGRKRSMVFVATSDQSPLLRLRCAMAATAAAEFHARRGKHVLLVLDSLTRFAMAARELGLAAGEPPASKGYTPSVFTRLAKLVERAGNFNGGSITAFYTVLMEGDDQQDPIVDSVRSLLDGHIVLSRELAAEGWYPPIQVLDSLSRLMPAVTSREQREAARKVRRWMAAAARSADLVRMGAYVAGADAELDEALQMMPRVRAMLEQGAEESVAFRATTQRLMELTA